MTQSTKQVGTGWRAPGRARWRAADGQAMLAALAESGDSDDGFARAHGIGTNRIRYWRRMLRTEREGAASFVRVRAVAAVCDERRNGAGDSGRRVELELAGGGRLRFLGAWDAGAIEPWLRAMGAVS